VNELSHGLKGAAKLEVEGYLICKSKSLHQRNEEHRVNWLYPIQEVARE
jgi:hypothetical protein